MSWFLSPASAVEIQLEQSPPSLYGGGRYYAQCAFNGVFEKCRLDTGISFSKTYGTEFPKSSIVPGQIKVNLASSEMVTCDRVYLDQGTYGDAKQKVHRKELLVISCPAHPLAENLMGLDLIWKDVISIDLAKNLLEVNLPPMDPKKSAALARKIEPMSLHIVVPFLFGNRQTPTAGIFDTGASMTLVSWDFVKKNPDYFYAPPTRQYDFSTKDGEGNVIKDQLMLMNAADFQGKKVTAEWVMATDFTAIKKRSGSDIDFIIGTNWMRSFKWTFDLKQSLFTVESP